MDSPGSEVGCSNSIEDVAQNLEQHHKEEPHVCQRAVFSGSKSRGRREGGWKEGRGGGREGGGCAQLQNHL